MTLQSKRFFGLSTRIRVVNEQLDGYDIVMVPVGSIQNEFEMILEYTQAISFPKTVSARVIPTLSSKQTKVFSFESSSGRRCIKAVLFYRCYR